MSLLNPIPEQYKVLSANALKIIALIAMLIDHLAAGYTYDGLTYLYHNYNFTLIYQIMRDIGRIAFPIFVFFLVEGFHHTHDRIKYLRRMVIFSLISEIPFDFGLFGHAFIWSHQNVFMTLSLGLLMMLILEEIHKRIEKDTFWITLSLLILVIFCMVASLIRCDYSYYGITSIYVFYMFYGTGLTQILMGALSFGWEPFALFAFPLFLLYNGERGKQIKALFYWFYPIHLFIIFLLGSCLFFAAKFQI